MVAERVKTLVPAGCIVIGVALLGVSLLWPRVFPATLYWQDQHEDRLERASQYVHNTLYRVRQAEELGKSLDPQLLEEYERATTEGEQLRRQSEAARWRPQQIAARWRWAGILVLAVGLVALYVGRSTSD